MKRMIVGWAIFLAIPLCMFADTKYQELSAPVVYAAEEKEVPVELIVRVNWTEERINQEVKAVADRYQVSANVMHKVIDCESQGSTTVQSRHILKGVREDSWGLVQINLPSHPYVTKEQALDPAFALDFLGRELRDGNGWMWTCWRNLADNQDEV